MDIVIKRLKLSSRQAEALRDLIRFHSLEIGSQVNGKVAESLRRKGMVETNFNARFRSIRLTENGESYAKSL